MQLLIELLNALVQSLYFGFFSLHQPQLTVYLVLKVDEEVLVK
jgi:hypothetical protein